MKKYVGWFMVCTTLMILALSGCVNNAKQFLEINTVAESIKNTIVFQDEMSELSSEMTGTIYPIQEQDVEKSRVFISTGATAEEIAVFEAKDAESAQRIYDGIKSRIADQINAFRNYVPAELVKLENPVLVKEGKYIVLCISNENGKAQALVNAWLKQ